MYCFFTSCSLNFFLVLTEPGNLQCGCASFAGQGADKFPETRGKSVPILSAFCCSPPRHAVVSTYSPLQVWRIDLVCTWHLVLLAYPLASFLFIHRRGIWQRLWRGPPKHDRGHRRNVQGGDEETSESSVKSCRTTYLYMRYAVKTCCLSSS